MRLGSSKLLLTCASSVRKAAAQVPAAPQDPHGPHMAGAGLCLESRYGSWHQSALLSRTGLRHLCRHTGMSASTKLGSQYSPKSLFLWPPGDYQLQGSGYSLRQTRGSDFHHMSPSLVSVSCDLRLVAIALGHGPSQGHSLILSLSSRPG